MDVRATKLRYHPKDFGNAISPIRSRILEKAKRNGELTSVSPREPKEQRTHT